MRVSSAAQAFQIALIVGLLQLTSPWTVPQPKGNLSSEAEDIHKAVKKIQDMVSNIKEDTGDWLDQLFKDLGLSSWTGTIIKTVILVLFIVLIILIAIGVVQRLFCRLVSNTTTSPNVEPCEPEEFEIEDLETSEEDQSFVLEQDQPWPVPFEE